MKLPQMYETKDGYKPGQAFLDDVRRSNKSIHTKFRGYLLDELEDKGIELSGPHSKHLEDGIHELRTRDHNVWYRWFYFFDPCQFPVMVNGVIKTERETPTEEIEKAKEYHQQHLNRFYPDES